jgi:nitrate reductase assembly molybdenum cofactor insertion protein NarJ
MSAIAASEIGESHVTELLREATAWRLLGLLFERPKDGWWREVDMLSREVADPEITAAAEAARKEASEGLYLALLGPGGPVSLREVTYRGMEDPGRIIADISAFYEAFAFQPETEEAPDHLAVEAGFIGYLCLKEAYARARGNEEEAELTANAAARLRETHLSTFAWPVAERLEIAAIRYLSLAASSLARRSGPPPDTRTTATDGLLSCGDCHMECGLE